ncbi:unnamed protein product [Blepharisma stoltei]|uniref:Uncharacterized protein n=1 Tax=Blepharisma stoltei TaxID=1481888 RepID=A0AAU9JPM4_9CILI|nr:unnamed protein product [Blepharisma stoltei]
MGSSNYKIAKEETEQDIAQSSTLGTELDLSPVHIDNYDLKGSSQEEMFKFIVSNYALMNRRIKDTKMSIRKEQKRASKTKTVPPQSPEKHKRKAMPRLTAVEN